MTLTSIRSLGLRFPDLILYEFGRLLLPDATSHLLELLNRPGLILRVRGRLAILYLKSGGGQIRGRLTDTAAIFVLAIY